MNNTESLLKRVVEWSGGKRGPLFLLGLSAFLKITFLVILSDKMFNTDGVIYISAAQEFAEGNFREGLAIYPMPFFSLIIAFVHFFIPSWLMAARLVSIISLILSVIPLYLLTRDLFNREAAFWGCLAFILAPINQEWTVLIGRGPIFLLFFAWAVFFAQRALSDEKIWLFFTTGFFACVAILCRIEGVLFIPVFAFFLVCLAVYDVEKRRHYLSGLSIWVLFPLVIVGALYLVMGSEMKSFNQIENVIRKVEYLFSLKFLDNYMHIYAQLEAMEKASIYPIGNKNFAEIARHLIWLIYLIGLLQAFIKTLFPLYAIPLFRCAWRPFSRTRVYVLLLLTSQLLLIYYFLAEQDFISRRFLFTSIFLIYPFIGSGLAGIIAAVRRSSRVKLYSILFVVFFIIAPIYKHATLIEKSDQVLTAAAQWLSGPGLENVRIIHNDRRIPFLAGRKSHGAERNNCQLYMPHDRDYRYIEKIALENKMDLIILKIKTKRKRSLPSFTTYRQVAEFTAGKKSVLFFGSREFLETYESGKSK
ncbi:MAG: hypothetical protein GY859_04915 [Desulfobacterales bacterium]|nr:hypothetical protein [Desulfobacterales bacterium]